MLKQTRRLFLIAGLFAAITIIWTSPGRAQQPAAKTAEQVYKNITHLKGTPADQLIPAMQFISRSLGVNCEFCHVEGKRELDEKQPKKQARDMIAMMQDLNKAAFNGRQTITCFTCHQGAEHPGAVPPVLTSDAPPHPETTSGPAPAAPMDAAANAALADQIAVKYLEATGGAEAWRKITARAMSGSITTAGNQAPVELYTQPQNKALLISRPQTGAVYTAVNGSAGWSGNAGRPARDMSSQEAWATAVQYELALPLRLKEIFPQLRRGRPEQVNGVDCVVLNATAPGKPPARLWFDADTGLLVRMLLMNDTPVGRIPTQVDFADYRDVDGVKAPFRWITSGLNRRSIIQLTDIKSNTPVEDARFLKPADAIK